MPASAIADMLHLALVRKRDAGMPGVTSILHPGEWAADRPYWCNLSGNCHCLHLTRTGPRVYDIAVVKWYDVLHREIQCCAFPGSVSLLCT